MRQIMSAFVIALAAGTFAVPAVRAADDSGSSTAPNMTGSDGQPKQYQDVKPIPGDSATRRDQSAQAPKSPAVIAPPNTGDKSVIVPPKDSVAKMPVIPPPGTRGDNNDVEPK